MVWCCSNKASVATVLSIHPCVSGCLWVKGVWTSWSPDMGIHFLRYLAALNPNIDGLVQDCSNSNATALEFLQSCAKPSLSNVRRICCTYLCDHYINAYNSQSLWAREICSLWKFQHGIKWQMTINSEGSPSGFHVLSYVSQWKAVNKAWL